jgi:4'-phosphopantetheinyl transferase
VAVAVVSALPAAPGSAGAGGAGVPDVGVDVELVDPRVHVDEMARLVLAEPERGGPPLDRDGFYRVWTRKEALLKATGDGLRTAMSALVLSPLAYPGRPGLRARLVDLAAGDGYAAAVAVLTDAPVSWRETTVTAP